MSWDVVPEGSETSNGAVVSGFGMALENCKECSAIWPAELAVLARAARAAKGIVLILLEKARGSPALTRNGIAWEWDGQSSVWTTRSCGSKQKPWFGLLV